jgi:hypothetical protein
MAYFARPPATLPSDYYVYEHRRATTGEVFYVGKGKGYRAWVDSNRSKHWQRIAKKHGVTVRIIISGLQEWAAHEIERDLISLHGRRDIGYGRLINVTDGGDGSSGYKYSEETRQKMSAAKKAKPQSQEARMAKRAAMNRPEVKQKLRAAQLGRATDKQLTASGATPVIRVETGERFQSLGAAARHLQTQNINTSAGSIKRSCQSGSKKAGGSVWRYADK